VITHHAPTPSVAGDKHDGHLCAAYANHWPELIDKADSWIFGHTHKFVDERLGGCRVISNPRGYPNEETGFRADFQVEI
jgi:predicted phosphodiesterase